MGGIKEEKLEVTLEKIEIFSLFKKKFNLNGGWELSKWYTQFLETPLSRELVLIKDYPKAAPKQINKKQGAKIEWQKNLPSSWFGSNFIFT